MAVTVIHIADFVDNKRVKTCDSTLLIPPGENDKNLKQLCEKCRQKMQEKK